MKLLITILFILPSLAGGQTCYWSHVYGADGESAVTHKSNWSSGTKDELMAVVKKLKDRGTVLFSECTDTTPSLNWAKRGYFRNDRSK